MHAVKGFKTDSQEKNNNLNWCASARRALPPVGPAHTCWGFVIRHEGTNRAVKGRHHMNVQCS